MRRRKLHWPDKSRTTLRATACESGPGPIYRPSHIFHSLDDSQQEEEPLEGEPQQEGEPQEGEPQEGEPRSAMLPAVPPLGPLADMTVGIIGFQREHEVSYCFLFSN